jgi:hypothetical protein
MEQVLIQMAQFFLWADRKVKRPCGATPSGVPPSGHAAPTAMLAGPARRDCPISAPRRSTERSLAQPG